MIVVIFELKPISARTEQYFDLAAALKAELEEVDGFISVERFRSLPTEGIYLSLSFWRDNNAGETWYNHSGHRESQVKGRADIFTDYRIRVAEVFRDYDMAMGRPKTQIIL